MHARHPKTRFVNAHVAMLYYDMDKVTAFLDKYPNADVEISAAVQDLGRAPRLIREFFLKYQDRILFGSDGNPGRGVEEFWVPHWRFLETYDEHFDHPAQIRSPTGAPLHGRWRIYGHWPAGRRVAEGLLRQRAAIPAGGPRVDRPAARRAAVTAAEYADTRSSLHRIRVRNEVFVRSLTLAVTARCAGRAIAAAVRSARHRRAAAQRHRGAGQLADLQRRLPEPSLQQPGSDHDRQRPPAEGQVDLPDAPDQGRDDADRGGRRDVRHASRRAT